MYQQAINTRRSGERDRLLVSSYAYAVSEENASGHRIVTAPTCGASGVLPAVLYYCYKQLEIPRKEIIKALAVAGIFGNVIKTNATISSVLMVVVRQKSEVLVQWQRLLMAGF